MTIAEQGILNQGERGTRRAMATFPSISALSDGTLLVAYTVGTTKDCDEETVELRRSADGGRTWNEPTSPFSTIVDGTRGSLKLAHTTQISEQHLMVGALWVDREAYPGKRLFDPDTEGCLPMAILVADSDDLGRTWSPWRVVPVPDDVGPPSLTSPILRLASGRLAISIETNKTYEDGSKWYQRVVYVYSSDQGKTWSAPVTVAQDPAGRIFNWDQRAGVHPDGRLVTFTWQYDRETTSYLNILRRISSDEGNTWTAPEDLGITDQPSHPAILGDGRVVLAWVDRYHTHSIRARVSERIDAPFGADTEVVIYEFNAESQDEQPESGDTGAMLVEQGLWTFGLPYAEVLPDGDVMIVYYAGSSERTDICWARLTL